MANIDREFQKFFNDWVEKQTDAAVGVTAMTDKATGGKSGRNKIRREIRDAAIISIKTTVERIWDNAYEMGRFENGE